MSDREERLARVRQRLAGATDDVLHLPPALADRLMVQELAALDAIRNAIRTRTTAPDPKAWPEPVAAPVRQTLERPHEAPPLVYPGDPEWVPPPLVYPGETE